MGQWLIKGIRTGIKTTVYPEAEECAPGVTPGRPLSGTRPNEAEAARVVDRCPTGALSRQGATVQVDYRRCVHCYRCVRDAGRPLDWESSYEWARAAQAVTGARTGFAPAFQRSLHIRVVDAGDCGACLNEVKQLNNPYYNMHRLGFFITPSPRQADVLLVVGPGTDHMREALRKAYDAMPAPKRVLAVGACAVSGGVFADSFVCGRGVAEVLPVDVAIPGHPPPPLAILHGLLVLAGRKPVMDLAFDDRSREER